MCSDKALTYFMIKPYKLRCSNFTKSMRKQLRIIVLFFVYLPSFLQAQEIDSTMWITDGAVLAIARSGNTVYLGGSFSCIGPNTGGGGAVNLTNGRLTSYDRVPNIKGQVVTSIPDGKGGWYIGGQFTHVQGIERNSLAHILADNSLDLAWNPNVKYEPMLGLGGIFTMTISENLLYIGGTFSHINNQERNSLAAINLVTGEVDSWQPKFGTQYIYINKLDIKNKTLYLGGNFQNVDNKDRNNLAAIDLSTHAVTEWNPNINGIVKSFVFSGDTIFVGGKFSTIGSTYQWQQNLAAINVHTGHLLSWNPYVDDEVSTLLLHNNTLYIGGNFRRNAMQGEKLAAIDVTTGNFIDWDPKIYGGFVSTLAISGNTLYVGGNFYSVGGRNRTHLAAIDITSGQISPWAPVVNSLDFGTYQPGGFVNSLTISGNKIYIGGKFYLLGAEKVQNLAALDASTGRLLPWKPNLPGTIRTMVISENTLYLAGDIGAIDGQTRSGLAAINILTGKATSWNPVINTSNYSLINNLEVHNNKAYFSSHFGKYIGIADLASGEVSDWNLQVDNGIIDFTISDDMLYVVGPFRNVNGQKRNNLAAFDVTDRQLTTWDPSNNYSYWPELRSVIVYKEMVITGGTSLMATDKNTAQLLAWSPKVKADGSLGSFSGIHRMSIYNGILYTGGYFNSIDDQPRNNVASIDIDKAEVTSWQANIITLPYCITFYENVIYVAGAFDENVLIPHFTAFGENLTELKSYIQGHIYEVTSTDCTRDENKKGIENIIIMAQPGPYYGITDSLGNYSIAVDTGTYTIQQVLSADKSTLIEQICPINPLTHTATFNTSNHTVSDKDFGDKITRQSFLTANVVSNRRRRCFTSTTTISYCNEGSLAASDVKIHLELPQHVILVSANTAYTINKDNNYIFTIGVLQPGICGTIQIKDSVVCDNPDIRGLTQCTKAWITPANTPQASPNWDRADIELKAKCLDNGRIKLGIYNTGRGSMADSSAYRIFLDARVIFSAMYKLTAGDSLILQVPANGQTLRLEADQHADHPTKKQSNITIEACGRNSEGKVSLGYVAQLPQDDAEPEVAIECLPIIDSFDPNDKLVLPIGVTENNYTPTNTPLNYTIRFQNTGTDYAYSVVVMDTLSEHLDISTLKIGPASHAYQWNVSGKGKPVLTFTFDNIMLPDSNTNEPQSHGYIKFSIKPKSDIAEKTRIENFADIFFDFNEPVRTNTTINSIYDLPLPAANDARIAFCNFVEQPSISQVYREDLVCNIKANGYEWFLNGKLLSATTQTIKAKEAGIYTVRIINKGCQSAMSAGFTFTLPEPLIANYFEIYPNPNHGTFTFYMQAPAGKVVEAYVWDALGRQVWNQTFISPAGNIIREKVTLSQLKAGMYIIKTTVDTPRGGAVKKLIIK